MANDIKPRIIDSQHNRTYELSGRIVTVGASEDCNIRLDGRKTAQRMAHFMYNQGAYNIQSVSPQLRIRVNGQVIGAEGRRIAHGDIIEMGEHKFEYRETGDEPGKMPMVSNRPIETIISTVVSLLHNRGGGEYEALVTSVSQLLRCDAARLVSEAGEGDERQRTIARYPGKAELDRFSSRAIEWARQAGQTVLMHNDEWDKNENTLGSLEKNRVASVLCAPLKEENSVIGYLYLDRLENSGPFTEEDRVFCNSLVPLFSTILSILAEKRRQGETIARLQKHSLSETCGIIYGSEIMAHLVSQAQKLAATDSPVLISGETGTGKELMARFIHDNSHRKGKPFKAINCGAIPENLIESELFGYEKGAFTGASQRKIGLFESAGGGTVLLDEIGELPVSLQVKFLRSLQESEIVRVGGTEPVKIDIRILAATNRVLEKEVAEGRFRQDLFFRLNVLSVTLPPLRERGGDIILLAEYFLKKYCDQFGLPVKKLSYDARGVLSAHPWQGNIRELENAVQKAILYSSGTTIKGADIQFSGMSINVPDGVSVVTTLKDARERAEKEIIVQTLEKTQGNISSSARILDIDRKWLMKKMEEMEISADTFRKVD